MEETRPGTYFPVAEDARGLYLFNSKDLALYRYVAALAGCGVTALKIEGRMKNAHYLAAVVSLYRRLLDGESIPEAEALASLTRVNHRGYSEGFMKGSVTPEDYQQDFGGYYATSTLIAHTTEAQRDGGRVCVVKNSLYPGETLELLTPDGRVRPYTVPNPLLAVDGNALPVAQNHHTVLLEDTLPAYAILRRVEEA
jgi:putative protease